MKPLTQEFFAKDTLDVAKSLLGKIIEINNKQARIVETESYKQDKASHAYKRTPRSALMYETYGYVYVYLIYGMYHCLNFTTEKGGVGAVLIRALEPLNFEGKLNGPGKLCDKLGITKEHNGSIIGQKIRLLDDGFIVDKIQATPRIGIKDDTHLEWRFYIKDNPHTSR